MTVNPILEYTEDLTPSKIAEHLESLGQLCDAIALIAADHPMIGQSIDILKEMGVPVVAYITDQSVPS